jgi:polar amino acid transport system substrate-binding protein
MKYRFWAAVSLSICILAAATQARADQVLTLFVTEIPGQSALSEEEPGAGLEIVRAVAKLGGFRLEERFVPWARAVSQVERTPMAVILPLSRTPSREDKFTWVTALYQLQFGFVSLDTAIDDLATARKLDLIGVWRGTSMEETLKKRGFTNLAPVSNDQALTRMLLAGRFQAWYGSLNEAAYKFRRIEEVNKKAIRFGKPIESAPVWLAGGPELPVPVATALRNAFEALKTDGSIARILEKYGMERFL